MNRISHLILILALSACATPSDNRARIAESIGLPELSAARSRGLDEEISRALQKKFPPTSPLSELRAYVAKMNGQCRAPSAEVGAAGSETLDCTLIERASFCSRKELNIRAQSNQGLIKEIQAFRFHEGC